MKPFLRWAGGKAWLVKHLHNVKKIKFGNYHEPFLGGGATFFSLTPSGNSYLSDLNGDLIETYNEIKYNVKSVIKKMKTFNNTENDYYQIRKKKFAKPHERAAKFIYLNQTSYNGIYRVNLNGVYNVPYGFRKKPFLDENTLLNAHIALQNAIIIEQDFFYSLDNIVEHDLVFLDPPYTVSHNDNGFIKYNEKIFSLEDQHRLSTMIDIIRMRGAYYILTNAAHQTIEYIFEKGDRKVRLSRANLIGGVNSKRGQTSEFVFSNIEL